MHLGHRTSRPRRTATLVTLLALLLAAVSTSVAAPPAVDAQTSEPHPDRIAGPNRYATAVAIAEHVTDGPPFAVFVARADDFVDALAAGSISGGPILLAPPRPGPAAEMVASAVDELDPDQFVGLGGNAAVSTDMLELLGGGDTIYRLAGRDRYETAAEIATWVFDEGAQTVYLARSDDPVDAVAGGSLTDGPVLPVPRSGHIPSPIRQAIDQLAPERVVALGGRTAIPAEVLRRAADGRDRGRLAGRSRYATAAAIATAAFPDGTDHAYIARGDVYADAVAAGPIEDGPVLLVPSCGQLPTPVADALQALGSPDVTAIGGPKAVCDDMLAQARGGVDPLIDPDRELVTVPADTTSTVDAATADAGVRSYDPTSGELVVRPDLARDPGEHIVLEPSRAVPNGALVEVTARRELADGDVVLDTRPGNPAAAYDRAYLAGQLSDRSGVVTDIADGVRLTRVDPDTGEVLGEVQESSLYEARQATASRGMADVPLVQDLQAELEIVEDGRTLSVAMQQSVDGEVVYEDGFGDIPTQVGMDMTVTSTYTLDAGPAADGPLAFDVDRPLYSRPFLVSGVPFVFTVDMALSGQVAGTVTWTTTTRYRSVWTRGEGLDHHRENLGTTFESGGATATLSLSGGPAVWLFRVPDDDDPFGVGVFGRMVLSLEGYGGLEPSGHVEPPEPVEVGRIAGSLGFELGARLRLAPLLDAAPTVSGTFWEEELYRQGAASPTIRVTQRMDGLVVDIEPPAHDPRVDVHRSDDPTCNRDDERVAATHGEREVIPLPARGDHWLCAVAVYQPLFVDPVRSRPSVARPVEVSELQQAARGKILETDGGAQWYVTLDGVRRSVPDGGTSRCLTAWKGIAVIAGVTPDQLEQFPVGDDKHCTVTEADGHVIEVDLEGETNPSWYVQDGTKRPIPDSGTFVCLTEWKGKPHRYVTSEQAEALPTGDNKDCTVDEVDGEVIETPEGKSYLVRNGTKHEIRDPGSFMCFVHWKGHPHRSVSTEAAAALPTGDRVGCTVTAPRHHIIREADGTAWYVTGDSVRRHLPAGGNFTCLTDNYGVEVMSVTQGQVDALPAGSDLRCSGDPRGKIVQDGGAQWFVTHDHIRRHVPDSGTSRCLTAWKGTSVIDAFNSDVISAMTRGSDIHCEPTEARHKILTDPDNRSWYVDGNLTRQHIETTGVYHCLHDVRGHPRIHVTWHQLEAIAAADGRQGCTALLSGPDGTGFFVDSSGERHWVPSAEVWHCLADRGHPTYWYDDWSTINLFTEDKDHWASC